MVEHNTVNIRIDVRFILGATRARGLIRIEYKFNAINEKQKQRTVEKNLLYCDERTIVISG